METEKRLIDANALGRDAFHIKQFGKGIRCVVDWDDIEAAPTVDAVEVVHGHWIFKHNPIDDPKRYFTRIVCSNCNLHTGQKSNYCPQCGAKMDGEDNVTNQNKT